MPKVHFALDFILRLFELSILIFCFASPEKVKICRFGILYGDRRYALLIQRDTHITLYFTQTLLEVFENRVDPDDWDEAGSASSESILFAMHLYYYWSDTLILARTLNNNMHCVLI